MIKPRLVCLLNNFHLSLYNIRNLISLDSLFCFSYDLISTNVFTFTLLKTIEKPK